MVRGVVSGCPGSARYLRIVILLVLWARIASGQEPFTRIVGRVADAEQHAVAGASIRVTGPSGDRGAVTDDAGAFSLQGMLPGAHTLIVTVDGRERLRIDDLVLSIERPLRLDLVLPAAVDAAIDVTARPVLIREGSDFSTTLGSHDIVRLPHGRDASSLPPLLPGVRQEDEAGGLQIDGGSAAENRYFVDAMDTTHPQKGLWAKEVPANFVEEIQVKPAGFRAEFGGATGGVVSLLTRSGGDLLQGSVGARYESRALGGQERPELGLSESGLEATHVRYRRDDIERIDPGVTLGGPLAANRMHFFLGYEGGFESTHRTVDFVDGTTREFPLDRRWTYLSANASASLRDNLVARLAFDRSPSSTSGGLPDRSGRGSSNPADYRGREWRDNDLLSLVVDYLPRPEWAVGFRAGQHRIDYRTQGASTSPYSKSFQVNSPSVFPEIPADLVRPVGFSTSPSFTLWRRDEYTRTALASDVTRSFRALGDHQIKLGFQAERLENSVLRDQSATSMEFQWNSGDVVVGEAAHGKYGALAVYRYQTGGDVRSDNLALFLQDSWRPAPGLTLDLGLRAESEEVPDYRFGHEGENAIKFNFSDKLAPRLGFAWTPEAARGWNFFGSYGKFFDVTKFELARVSFGAERRVRYVYALDGFDWPNISCEVRVNDPSSPPDCGPEARFVTAANLRNPSNDAIDPKLRPGEERQWQLGGERAFGAHSRFGTRLVHEDLVRIIEDIGAYVDGVGEVYVIGNPGEGRSRFAVSGVPLPKASRTYDALELTWREREARHSLLASYTYSRLRGNFPGLASSDESGRASPNVLRAYDAWFTPFGQSGRPIYGPLGTDRPHQLRIEGSIELGKGTTLGLVQAVMSGTPRTTRASRNQVYFFPYGRNDLGRNPTLTQTDLRLAQRLAIGKAELELSATVLNLFDEQAVLDVSEEIHAGSLTLTDAEFLAGFDILEVMRRQGLTVRPTYKQPSAYQAPREVLLAAAMRF